jgi:hypothetical protein
VLSPAAPGTLSLAEVLRAMLAAVAAGDPGDRHPLERLPESR